MKEPTIAISVVQNPPLATEGQEVTLTAKLNDFDVASPVTWSEVHGNKGESSGTFGQTYTIAEAPRGGTYRAEVGSESADVELRFPSEVKSSIEAQLEPMFPPRQLAIAAGALLIAATVAMLLPAILTFSLWRSMGSEDRLGVAMSLLMFDAGLVVVLGALWLQVANLRKPKSVFPMGEGVTDVATGVGMSAAAGTMAKKQVLKEKAPGAMALLGVVLMLVAGFVASQAVGETSTTDTAGGSCAYVLVIRRGDEETRITVPSGERPELDARAITIEDC
ncbi:MAG: hypothetical protein ACR2ME_02055 [Acidimicrobiia bacterium]